MNRIALALFALIALGASAIAQSTSVFVPATTASAPIAITTATTTLLVAGVPATSSPAKSIAVTAVDVISSGTGTIQFIAGTGATCGTGSSNVTGVYTLTAQVGFTKGSGNGALWALQPGDSLCAVTNAAVTMGGSVSYAIY